MPVERESRQSRNLDCAVRREVKEVVRWVSSRSSWDFSSLSCGIGSWVRSTGGFVSEALEEDKRRDEEGSKGNGGIYFGFLGLVWTPWFGIAALGLWTSPGGCLKLEVASDDGLAKSFPVECGEIAWRFVRGTT